MNKYLDIHPEVAAAIRDGKPVVALESTIISHGMPYPQNVETALNVERIIRENGAVPATIAIIGGRLKAGLSALGLQAPWQTFCTGLVVIGAVLLDIQRTKAANKVKKG